MTPFKIKLEPGVPVYQQVVYAARKAIVSGSIGPGERFPSVRQLSKSLKINPNTAQKIVSKLIDEGLLQAQPGIGTIVTHQVPDLRRRQHRLLREQIEALVVEAKQLSIPLDDVLRSLEQQWADLSTTESKGTSND